jgi:hypothetical protein
MHERAIAVGGVVVVALCCGAPAVIGGLLGGVAVGAIIRAGTVALLGLGAVAGVTVIVARRRRCHHDSCLSAEKPVGPLDVATDDPITGETIDYSINTAGTIQDLTHPHAVLSFLRPDRPWDDDVRATLSVRTETRVRRSCWHQPQ